MLGRMGPDAERRAGAMPRPNNGQAGDELGGSSLMAAAAGENEMTKRESEIEQFAKVPKGWTVPTWVQELRRKGKACADVRKDLALIYMDAADRCERNAGMKVADAQW